MSPPCSPYWTQSGVQGGKDDNHDVYFPGECALNVGHCASLPGAHHTQAAGGVQVIEVSHIAPFRGEGADDVVVVQIPEFTAQTGRCQSRSNKENNQHCMTRL
jgi:hypothetical protein